ncbi:hypothetical protein DF200_00095 [Bifidobacterium catulorum]|uniref:Uncharacterized protein n=1 Tax=Bifidobacterium catulorum TaxID=1630173 RepID=A0A2U2MUY4_9BIFI|nr:hypothetical protein DF200_00095 [Bifidobacterium catulorum]
MTRGLPPPHCLAYYQTSRRYLFLNLALGRRPSFMVSSIIAANDGGRTPDERLLPWIPSAACNPVFAIH